MAKILDPDLLNQGTEVDFLSGSRLIRLNKAGNLSDDGVSLQSLYSFIKEEWKNDANLIKFPFPILSITSEQFEFINGWDLSGSASKFLIKDAGWALVSGSVNTEEWMNITTLGAFVTSSDQAYFVQSASLDVDNAPSNFQLSGEVNQGVQIYQSGSYDYRDYFKVFLRERGKTYASYNLLTEQSIASLTYRKFALPLSNAIDLNITGSTDTLFDANSDGIADVAPYDNMSIRFVSGSSESFDIGGTSYNFNVVIEANNGSTIQVYNFVQWSLRQAVDIDSGSGERRGDIAEELLDFVGSTLRTRFIPGYGGVYVNNFRSDEINSYEFTDNTNTVRTFPFVSTGVLTFNDNLQNDTNAIYKVFFTNDDAGDNTGRDFGTQNAIIINKYTGLSPLTGSINGSSSLSFDYDYDNNIQRGSSSSGSDAPYTAVALGLGTAQYTVTTGNVTRSTSNNISFVANLERNYLNPA
jgi:hypothetical protein